MVICNQVTQHDWESKQRNEDHGDEVMSNILRREWMLALEDVEI